MRVITTHHVAISTPIFSRLREFYVETLGLPVVGRFAGHEILFIGAGGSAIELIGEATPRADGVSRSGWHHLAWQVEDVDETYAELSALGVPFRVPPEDFPEEAPSMRIAFLQDPDGTLLELVQPLGS